MKPLRLILAATTLTLMAAQTFAGPNCTCRYKGQNFETGSVVCIRGKLAKCEFVLNNTSWKFISELCPQTTLPQKLQSTAQPVTVTMLDKLRRQLSPQ
jgi:hypothetical protein